MRKTTTRFLAESAIFIALATVLSFIKFDLPFGGGVTLVSMLPILLLSHRWGWQRGVLAAFVYGCIQLLLALDNGGYATSFVMALGVIMLDYILAYTGLGFSGAFGNSQQGVYFGILVTVVFRFVCHWLSGVWIWGEWMPDRFMDMTMTSPWIYSLLYNGWYMLIELIITEVVAMAVYVPLGKYIRGEDLPKTK